MTMRSWIRNLFTRPATRSIRKAPPRFRPALETLEDRWVPSTIVVDNPTDAPRRGQDRSAAGDRPGEYERGERDDHL